jgi:hypothetical protein
MIATGMSEVIRSTLEGSHLRRELRRISSLQHEARQILATLDENIIDHPSGRPREAGSEPSMA